MSPTDFGTIVQLSADACSKGWTSLLDCPQEWQTFLGAVVALLAAIVAYLAAKLREDREDRRRCLGKDAQRRILAISLAVAFDAAGSEFRRASRRARGIAIAQELERATPTFARLRKSLAIRLPKVLDGIDGRIGDLGATNAALASATIQIIRASADDYEIVASTSGPNDVIQSQTLRLWQILWEKNL